MKKFFKALALVLALALVIGVVPAQATSAKIKTKKTLYVDGAKGTSTDGKLTSGYKSRVAIYKLAGDKKAVAADHTYKAVIKSGDSVTKTKKYVYAADLGKSVVEIFRDGESLGESTITVKKNATADTLKITGLEDGQEVVCGVKTTITLPRKGADSDERRLFVNDKEVKEVEGQARVYEYTFTKAGDYKVRFEAFQSAELDAVTTPAKEITVKAVMPNPVSAKQDTANSFSVEFAGDMTGLITKEDITNQMIYYKIADKPVVTGVVKDVKVDGKVVTITMAANFKNSETYYFAFGDAEAVTFKTATNEAKYVTEVVLIPEDAYYVDTPTKITYKLLNADGVELDVPGHITFEVNSSVATGYEDGGVFKINFWEEGTATVKASFDTTLYNEETYEAITIPASVTLTGTKRGAAVTTGSTYSFESTTSAAGVADTVKARAAHENHQIRLTAGGAGDAVYLNVKYDLSYGDPLIIESGATVNGTDYTIKSSDETVVMVLNNKVYGVNQGSAYIVLYAGDTIFDAFPITVSERNHAKSATVTPSKNTLNVNAGVAGTEEVKFTVAVPDLDGDDDNFNAYTVKVEQQTISGTTATLDAATLPDGGNTSNVASFVINKDSFSTLGLTASTADKVNTQTVRIKVTVKDNFTGKEMAVNYFNIAVADIAPSLNDGYKVVASENALDASIKNYGDKNPIKTSSVTLNLVRNSSAGQFNLGTTNWNATAAKEADLKNLTVASGAATDPTQIILVATAPKDAHANYNFAANPMTVKNFTGDSATIDNLAKATAGTYTFVAYKVTFDKDTGAAKKWPTIGSASVVVSANDIKPVITVKDGKAETLETALGDFSKIYDVFNITWDGRDTNTASDRTYVSIANEAAIDRTFDNATNSYFVRSIVVTLLNSSDTNGVKTKVKVDVNKLFKDK